MARPRMIQLEGGTVTLTNFPTERADEIEQMLTKPKSEGIIAKFEEHQGDGLTDVAVGLTYNKVTKEFFVVEIKFDLASNKAAIINSKKAGDFKAQAQNTFKIECVQHGLV